MYNVTIDLNFLNVKVLPDGSMDVGIITAWTAVVFQKIIKKFNIKTFVSDEARTINNVTAIPTTVEAGTPFSIDFEILDKNGARLTTGTDSVLFGELQVAWENDTVLIYDRINREDILFQEMVGYVRFIFSSSSCLVLR